MSENYIYSYYQKIKDGSITAGNWVIKVYTFLVLGLENKSFFYDSKKANAAVKFVENFVHHHEGALAPQKLKLELWEKALISAIFGIVDEDGLRVFREVFVVIARKNGKTLLAAAIALYALYLDGEYGARIYFAAPKLEQASLCFDAFYQSINYEPALKSISKKRRTDIYVSETNSSAKPLAFSAKKSDGFNISTGICDEIASWSGDQGLKMYEVMKSSQGARKQPLLVSISTAGFVNDGIYDELMRRSTRFLLGDSKEKRLLPVMYIIDAPTRWNDINELRKSNPNLGVSVSVDYLLEEIAIAEGSLSKKAEFLTKYCNIKQSSSLAWLSAQAVEKACGEHLRLEDFKGCYATVGIDLSQTTDLTACVVEIEKNGELYFIGQFFMPSEKIEEATARDGLPYSLYVQKGILTLSGDNFIDYKDCFNWVCNLVREYKIYPLQVGYDRYSAQYLIQDLNAEGLHTDDVFQGFNLTPVINEFEGLIKDGKVHIGDNDLLKVHFLNSALKIDAESERRKLVKIAQTEHIDGMAAVLDAHTVRQKWHSEIGETLKNKEKK